MDAPLYPEASVNRCNILCIIGAIFFSILDVIFDYTLGITYFVVGEYSYGICTAAFVFVPALINIYISERMYKQDLEMSENPEIQKRYQSISSKLIQRRFSWIFIILIPLVPVLRCIDSLRYALNAYNSRKRGDRNNQVSYYKKMLKEDQDIALLRVFECFLEAAPQAILQLTILLKNYQQPFRYKQSFQVFGICIFLIITGLTMSNYNRVVRLIQPDKSNITKFGFVLQFLSHYMITVSRFVTVGAMASFWLFYTCIFTGFHWLGMTIWIWTEHSTSMGQLVRDRSRALYTSLTLGEEILSRMLAAVFGVIYIFVYINLSEGSTFYGRLCYYVLSSIENITACTLWAYFATPEVTTLWWYNFVIVLCIVPFFIGTISIIFYYLRSNVTKEEKPTAMTEINGMQNILMNNNPINGQSKHLEITRLNQQS